MTVEQAGEIALYYQTKLHAKETQFYYVTSQAATSKKDISTFLENSTALNSENLVTLVLIASKETTEAAAWQKRDSWDKLNPTGNLIMNGIPSKDEVLVCTIC
jgi:hypothetical protein